VCKVCTTCESPLSNELVGHQFIRVDNGSYLPCSNNTAEAWFGLSVVSRSLGAQCLYAPPCMEWTGLRPYKSPQLDVGVGFVNGDAPSGRSGHAAALLLNQGTGERDVMLMFGGYSVNCLDYCNDTWTYSVPYNLWSQPANLGRAPARRWKHAMTDYLDTAFLFGGYGQRLPLPASGVAPSDNEIYDAPGSSGTYDPSNPLYFGDLWYYNLSRASSAGSSWTLVSTSGAAPAARYGASLVSYQDCLYLFGGVTSGGSSTFQYLYPTPVVANGTPNVSAYNASLLGKYYQADTWQYNVTAGAWKLLRKGGPGAPGARGGHAAALSLRGSQAMMVVVGGTSWDDQVGDAWQFNLSSFTWSPLTGDGTFPSRRQDLVLVPVGQMEERSSAGGDDNAGFMLLGFGRGCLAGSNYTAASLAAVRHNLTGTLGANGLGAYSGYDVSLSRSGNGTISVFGSYVNTSTGQTVYSNVTPDLWVEIAPGMGEKYCVDMLDDLWEYSPVACPSDCSRHGTCSFNTCICDHGFWGVDCSLLTCPGSACSFDYTQRSTSCAFCSGRGTCDGRSGACLCNATLFATSFDCSQASCPGECSGHGTCDHTLLTNGLGTCTVRPAQRGARFSANAHPSATRTTAAQIAAPACVPSTTARCRLRAGAGPGCRAAATGSAAAGCASATLALGTVSSSSRSPSPPPPPCWARSSSSRSPATAPRCPAAALKGRRDACPSTWATAAASCTSPQRRAGERSRRCSSYSARSPDCWLPPERAAGTN